MPKCTALYLVLLLILAILLAGCSDAALSQAEIATPDGTEWTATANSSGPYNKTTPFPEEISSTPSPTPTPEPVKLSEYTMEARLDYDTRHIEVEQTIDYINDTGVSLMDMVLVVDPNRFPGAFKLKEFTWEDEQVVIDYTLSGLELRFPLKEPLDPGYSLSMNLSYELFIPQIQGPFGYTNRQVNVSDWYPYVPPYIPGDGWLVREASFVGEHLAYDMANFTVSVQLPRPVDKSGNTLVVAASALAETVGDWRHYRLESARNFAWTVSHLYQVQETKVGDVTVFAYAFPFHQAAEDTAFKETAAALNLFNELFSPYPYESLSVVEGDFLDGMEYSGLFFLSHRFYDYHTGNPMGNLTIITAHEVSHQWWYGLIGNDQALEPWLDEALSTYSEVLFYEQVYTDLVGWWWDNRIYFHKPVGWVDSTIYEAGGFYPYRDAVYLRGAMFLQELRNLMGDEAFFGFLRDYLDQFTNRLATGDDFFNLLGEHTQEDLNNLLSNYFAKR